MIADWQHIEIQDLVQEWSKFDWARASELREMRESNSSSNNNEKDSKSELLLFSNNLNPENIKLGRIDDHYFLSVVAALTEKPERLKRLFVSEQVN